MVDMSCNAFSSIDMDDAEEALVPKNGQKKKGSSVQRRSKSVVQLLYDLDFSAIAC